MNKLNEVAVCISNDAKTDIKEIIDAISLANFTNVFIQWYDKDWPIGQKEQLDYARRKGLNVIFVHLGYQTFNNIWLDDPIGDLEVERYKKDILDCHNNGIDLVCMHACCHTNPPAISQIGLERFKEIVAYAEKLNVKIALENTKVKGYVEFLLDNIDSEYLGICYDAGHCHAHFNDDWDLTKYKGKIMCVHLHDNDGKNDLHLLPFDGTNNWDNTVNKLKQFGYDQYVTLETVYHRDYVNMTPIEFYKKCYELANRLKEMFI